MPPLLRSLRALSLALWVGGIFFFAFGVAPVAFHVLSSPHQAGLVVGASLIVLHHLGLTCAAIYLLALALSRTPIRRHSLRLLLPAVFVGLMLALTLTSHLAILPRMEADRASAGGDLTRLPLAAPTRIDFDRLHALSEKLEGATLLLGLAALALEALSPQPSLAPSRTSI